MARGSLHQTLSAQLERGCAEAETLLGYADDVIRFAAEFGESLRSGVTYDDEHSRELTTLCSPARTSQLLDEITVRLHGTQDVAAQVPDLSDTMAAETSDYLEQHLAAAARLYAAVAALTRLRALIHREGVRR